MKSQGGQMKTVRLDALQVQAAQFHGNQPNLERALVEPDGTFVVTDGWRLVIVPPNKPRENGERVILDAAAIARLTEGKSRAEVDEDGTPLFDGAVGGDFPKYEAIPVPGPVTIYLNAHLLAGMVEFARAEHPAPIQITIDPEKPEQQVTMKFRNGSRVVTMVLMPMRGNPEDFTS